jgi:hypothetical protein
MDSIRNPFFASAVATVDRVLAAQVTSIFSTQILNNLKPADIGAFPDPIVKSGYSFAATGNTTAEVLQATYTFPGGCIGPNGYLEGNVLVNCTASANAKRIRAFISNTNDGLSGTRFINYNIGSSATSVIGMRGFYLYNTGSENSQITQPETSSGTTTSSSSSPFQELSIDTSKTFYVTIALQKDTGGETMQTKLIRLNTVYGA